MSLVALVEDIPKPSPQVDERPSWLSTGRLPCLDGLRAISIGLVLLCHFTSTIPRIDPRVERALEPYGSVGVEIFFVISGFLITLLMFREENRTGRISLANFYLRRALRIVPAYLGYLLFALILTGFGVAVITPKEWIASLTYTVNLLSWVDPGWVVTRPSVAIEHLWSLAVEEHFYLLWPPALFLLGRQRSKILIVLACSVTPFIRYYVYKTFFLGINIQFCTITRMDSIALGCLLAYILDDPRAWKVLAGLKGWSTPLVLGASAMVAFSPNLGGKIPVYKHVLSFTVESSAIAIILFSLLSNPRSMVGRLLEARPMVAVGVLSYSLYLWQQPFCYARSGFWITKWPQNIVLAVGAAIFSHVLIERPFLSLKDRLSGKRAGLIARHVAWSSPGLGDCRSPQAR